MPANTNATLPIRHGAQWFLTENWQWLPMSWRQISYRLPLAKRPEQKRMMFASNFFSNGLWLVVLLILLTQSLRSIQVSDNGEVL